MELFQDDLDTICNRIVAVNETWCCQYDAGSIQESMQWIKTEKSHQKEIQLEMLTSKIMATILWKNKEILLINFLPKRTTMNGQYYINFLSLACVAVVQKIHDK